MRIHGEATAVAPKFITSRHNKQCNKVDQELSQALIVNKVILNDTLVSRKSKSHSKFDSTKYLG